MINIRKEKGFAILTTAILLSMASIVFSVNMASTQLIDNQIVANNYRNQQAFVNAESGINLILSKFDDATIAKDFVRNLPYEYTSKSANYTVKVSLHDNFEDIVSYGRLYLESTGRSADGTAKRTVHLKLDYAINFNVPESALSSNGKLNLDSSATINDGCEMVGEDDCRSKGNLAKNVLESNPGIETEDLDGCSGDADDIGKNVISADASYDKSDLDESGHNNKIVDNGGNWGDFYGTYDSFIDKFDLSNQISGNVKPASLFEKTFGVPHTSSTMSKIEHSDRTKVITDSSSCSATLDEIKNNEESAATYNREAEIFNTTKVNGVLPSPLRAFKEEVLFDVIYIQGDCDIDQKFSDKGKTSENKRFTLGSVKNPKIVLMEGGTFKTQPNSGASILGMLYFLPPLDTSEVATMNSVDMGGIRVNGATLSEYKCSHDGYDKTDTKKTKQHYSVRFDRTVLNNLYESIGMTPQSGRNGSHYKIIEGSWRDFE